MKYFSTFSGIGGFELGIHSIFPDAKCVGYSENDKYADQTYLKNFPNHKNLNFGDIKELVYSYDENKKEFYINENKVSNLPDFDLLVGGSPCQDLSIANSNRKGLDGKKSGLFFAYLEILRIKKPKYFILENVASMSNENKNKITEFIKNAGYNVEPMMINSNLVSAQNRKRLYWFNWKCEQPEDRGLFLKDVVAWSKSGRKTETGESYLEYRETKTGKTNTLTTGEGCGSGFSKNYIEIDKYSERCQQNIRKNSKTINEKAICIGTNGNKTGSGVNILKEFFASCHGNNPRIITKSKTGKANCLTSSYHKGLGANGRPGIATENIIGKNYSSSIKSSYRMLTTIECERLQTFPDNWTNGVSNTQRYKQLGNAVTVEVIKHIMKNHPENNQMDIFEKPEIKIIYGGIKL